MIADGQMIAGSPYKWGNRLELSSDSLRGAAQVRPQEIAAEKWQPRPIYCVDVAFSSGRYRLVEIGGINSAGLYHCELLPVIRAMNAIAERDFRQWKGKPYPRTER